MPVRNTMAIDGPAGVPEKDCHLVDLHLYHEVHAVVSTTGESRGICWDSLQPSLWRLNGQLAIGESMHRPLRAKRGECRLVDGAYKSSRIDMHEKAELDIKQKFDDKLTFHSLPNYIRKLHARQYQLIIVLITVL